MSARRRTRGELRPDRHFEIEQLLIASTELCPTERRHSERVEKGSACCTSCIEQFWCRGGEAICGRPARRFRRRVPSPAQHAVRGWGMRAEVARCSGSRCSRLRVAASVACDARDDQHGASHTHYVPRRRRGQLGDMDGWRASSEGLRYWAPAFAGKEKRMFITTLRLARAARLSPRPAQGFGAHRAMPCRHPSRGRVAGLARPALEAGLAGIAIVSALSGVAHLAWAVRPSTARPDIFRAFQGLMK